MGISQVGLFANAMALWMSSVAALGAETVVPAPATPAGSHEANRAAAAFVAAVTLCDELASPPGDARLPGKGVGLAVIDVARALPACELAARQSSDRPRYQYLYGRVLDAAQRHAEAAYQYAAATNAGNARAAAALGSLHYLGLGTSKDEARAIALFQRAGDAGYADAYAILGAIYLQQRPPDHRQALVAYDRAARAGSPLGQVGLGELHGSGLGVTRDQARAVALFRQAADKGEPLGMFDLGVSYLVGAGVNKDPETAFRWLLRAAERNVPQAQKVVAHMYEQGVGVARNREQAIAWYRKVAALGDPVGKAGLARLQANAPASPYRPLPAQRADAGISREAAILVGLGLTAAVWWLMSGSSASSSDAYDPPDFHYNPNRNWDPVTGAPCPIQFPQCN